MDIANHVNSDTAEEVVGQLVTLEREQERLNYYVSLLNPRHAELLKLLYFEGYSQEECAKKLEIATRTVRRIKDDAIEELHFLKRGPDGTIHSAEAQSAWIAFGMIPADQSHTSWFLRSFSQILFRQFPYRSSCRQTSTDPESV